MKIRHAVFGTEELQSSRIYDTCVADATGMLVMLVHNEFARLLLIDKNFEIAQMLRVAQDVTKVAVSSRGDLLVLNGLDPTVIFSNWNYSAVSLRNICDGAPVISCAFTKREGELLVWTSNSELIVVDLTEGIACKRRIAVPENASVLDAWSFRGESYASTWEPAGNAAVFSVYRLGDGKMVISSTRYRSCPIRIDKDWLAIIDSGVFQGELRVENLLTEESLLHFPCDDNCLCVASGCSRSKLLLHECMALPGFNQGRTVTAWGLGDQRPLFEWELGNGRSVLCRHGRTIASTENLKDEHFVSFRSTEEGADTETLELEKRMFDIDCPEGGDRLIILDDQLGAASECIIVDVDSGDA